MKVENFNGAVNQFLITEEGRGALGNFTLRETFQSYDTVIAVRTTWEQPTAKKHEERIKLDRNRWDYSKTTGKYRNQFLGESKAETERKIASGEYELADLN